MTNQHRQLDMKMFDHLYSYIDNEGMCIYCGQYASEYDHFVPISVANCIARAKLVKVPSCRECNSIAGSKIFPTIGAKRRHIQSRLASKNIALLYMPEWTAEELLTYSRAFQEYILKSIDEQQHLIRRIQWRNSRLQGNVNPVERSSKLRERLGILEKSSAVRRANSTGIISSEKKFSTELNRIRPCPVCGNVLRGKQGQMFCSNKCRIDAHRKKSVGSVTNSLANELFGE